MIRTIKRLEKAKNGIQYISDQSIREELSPFVFFDAGTMKRKDNGLFIGLHPHSGIEILTYFEGGKLMHNDTGDNHLEIRDGGLQWIRAGSGVLHEENYQRPHNAKETWNLTIHQLWLQLPPEWEEAEVAYQQMQPEQVPQVGNVKVLIGTYLEASSPIQVPYNMTYLDISLRAGEAFHFESPGGQTSGFIFPRSGEITVHSTPLLPKHLGLLENSEGLVSVEAQKDTKFVLATSAPQTHPIITHRGSIHTNTASLNRSLKKISSLIESQTQ